MAKAKPTSNGHKPKRASNGQFKPGQSGNPGGRKKAALDLTALIRNHPDAEKFINACFRRALDKKDPDSFRFSQALLDRMVPTLRSTEITGSGPVSTGVIYLPQQVAVEEVEVEDID